LQSLYLVKYFIELSAFWSVMLMLFSYSVSCLVISFYDFSKSKNVSIHPQEAKLYEAIYNMTEKQNAKNAKSKK